MAPVLWHGCGADGMALMEKRIPGKDFKMPPHWRYIAMLVHENKAPQAGKNPQAFIPL